MVLRAHTHQPCGPCIMWSQCGVLCEQWPLEEGTKVLVGEQPDYLPLSEGDSEEKKKKVCSVVVKQGRIRDLKLGVAQMDWKTLKSRGWGIEGWGMRGGVGCRERWGIWIWEAEGGGGGIVNIFEIYGHHSSSIYPITMYIKCDFCYYNAVYLKPPCTILY